MLKKKNQQKENNNNKKLEDTLLLETDVLRLLSWTSEHINRFVKQEYKGKCTFWNSVPQFICFTQWFQTPEESYVQWTGVMCDLTKCSWTGQLGMLPHWDRSCRANLQFHQVTVCWHRANQSKHWSLSCQVSGEVVAREQVSKPPGSWIPHLPHLYLSAIELVQTKAKVYASKTTER